MAEVNRSSAAPPAERFDLEAFLGSHGDRLYRSAWLLCGNETDAQDLVQETLVQAVQSLHRFRGDSAVYTWVHGILLNVSRRHHRQQKRFVYDETLIEGEKVPPVQPEISDLAVCSSSLAQALQSLSPEHREVVVLRYYEDQKIGEIARQTGVSVGTVKSRLHYAVRCLGKLISPEMNLFAATGTHSRET